MFFFENERFLLTSSTHMHNHYSCGNSGNSHNVTFPRIVHSKTILNFGCSEPRETHPDCKLQEATLLFRNCIGVHSDEPLDRLMERMRDHGVKYLCIRGCSSEALKMVKLSAAIFSLVVVEHGNRFSTASHQGESSATAV